MNKKGFANILVIVVILAILVIAGYFIVRKSPTQPISPVVEQPPITQTTPPINNQQRSTGESKPVLFEKVNFPDDWRLKDSFDYSAYKGIMRNNEELKKVWSHMEDINRWHGPDAISISQQFADNARSMPVIDFGKYSVIWYADRGSGASFTTMKKVLEHDNFIQAEVTPIYSDFGSNNLNLWTIPKTNKDIRFLETKEYEPGP